MQLYVRRNGEEFGPYSRETLLEYVVAGAFETTDTVCYAGMSDWKNLGEFFGIEPGQSPGQVEDIENSGKITEFNPTWNPAHTPGHSHHHRPRGRNRRGSKGWLIGGTLFAVFLAATMGYKWFGGNSGLGEIASDTSTVTPSPSASPTPVPTPEAVASPTPVATSTALPFSTPSPIPPPGTDMAPDDSQPDNSMTSPAPEQTPKPTPIPTPPPFDAASLTKTPGDWPKTLRLKHATEFPVVLDGRNVGTVTVQAGQSVDLVKVQGEKVVISFQGGAVAIPWQQTDLKERVESNPAYIPAMPPPTGSGGASVTPSPAASGGFVAPPS